MIALRSFRPRRRLLAGVAALALLLSLALAPASPATTPAPAAAPAASAPAAPPAQAAPPAEAAPPGAPADPVPGFIEQYTATLRFSLGTPQAIRVTPGGEAVLFLRSAPRSFVLDLYELDVASGAEKRLASAEQLLAGAEEHLSAAEKARRERARQSTRGIGSFDLSQDGSRLLVPLSGRLFVIERRTGAVHELPAPASYPLDPRLSPDGTRVAFVVGGELQVMEVASGATTRVTSGAGPTLSHGLAEFVAQEEMARREGYWWAPDSRSLAFEEADTSQVEVLHIADPMHPDRPADAWPYPRPGHNNAVVRVGLVSAAGGPVTWVEWDRQAFPYLAAADWSKGAPLTLVVQNREQTEERVVAVDAQGAARTLLTETDAAWLNLHPPLPRWLADGSGFLWISESSGEPRLVLCGRDGGAPCRPLSPPGFGLRSFVGLAGGGATAASASGPAASSGSSSSSSSSSSSAKAAAPTAAYVVAAADPTQTQLWRLPIAPAGAPVQLTREPGNHGAVFARDGSAAVWSALPLAGDRVWSVHRGAGAALARLQSVAEPPLLKPNMELATLGPLGFHAVVIRPRDFTPGKRYPVLVQVYAGPTVQQVRADPWTYLLDQWMADHGYIVFTMDGRGTPGRGRDWERVIKGNLIDVQLADQAAGLLAAGERYPEMDLQRAGIVGWSFGGYFSAMAAMRRPDVFHAAVAGAPVCDWQDYDTHYTERYLGLPQANPDGYRKSSVLTYCPDLKVPLLIVHGTADDNVYMMHSLKMTDALFRAGRPYEFLLLPGFTHMVPDAAVQRALQERIMSFFAARLGA